MYPVYIIDQLQKFKKLLIFESRSFSGNISETVRNPVKRITEFVFVDQYTRRYTIFSDILYIFLQELNRKKNYEYPKLR